jgi:hypothetical protein
MLRLALPGVAAAQSPAYDPDTATAGTLLLWLGLFAAFGLLLFWGLPLAVVALIACHWQERAATALLWAARPSRHSERSGRSLSFHRPSTMAHQPAAAGPGAAPGTGAHPRDGALRGW